MRRGTGEARRPAAARRTGRVALAPTTLVLAALTLACSAPVLVPASAASTARDASGPVAWAVASTVRVPIVSRPGPRRAVAIEAARGETESFQVAVQGHGGRLTGASLSVSPLRRAGGGEIGGASITRYREQYVRVARHSPGWSGRPVRWTWFPDALVPFVDPVTGRAPRPGARVRAAPFTVDAGDNQPVWVDVAVPRDALPGAYTGTWTVTSAQGQVSGPVSLRVRDVTLPVAPASGSRFGIWQPADRTAAVEDLLLRYRVQPGPATPAREPALRGAGLASADLGFWSGADVARCAMAAPPSPEALAGAVAAHDPALRLYDYTADEVGGCPGLTARLAEWGRALHAAGVDQLVTVPPRADLMDDGTGRPAVDIWVLTPWQLRALDPALRAQVLAAGGELWSYQALVQGARTPSWQLDFPATNYRLLGGFLDASQGVSGLLYWAVDRWQRDPWSDPTYTYPSSCCYPGDGTLVYPGAAAGLVGVVPSVRLAMVRDGMDDFDDVALLRQRGLGAEAAAAIAPAASSWSRWSGEPRVLATVRDRLLDLLELSAP